MKPIAHEPREMFLSRDRIALSIALVKILRDLIRGSRGREPALVGATEVARSWSCAGLHGGVDADFFGVLANFASSSLLSIFSRCDRPCGHAKIEAMSWSRSPCPSDVRETAASTVPCAAFPRPPGPCHPRPINRGHQPERAIALRHGGGLHVAVLNLCMPDIACPTILKPGDHVVDQRCS